MDPARNIFPTRELRHSLQLRLRRFGSLTFSRGTSLYGILSSSLSSRLVDDAVALHAQIDQPVGTGDARLHKISRLQVLSSGSHMLAVVSPLTDELLIARDWGEQFWSGMAGGSFSRPAFGTMQASLTLDLNYRSSELSQLAGVSVLRLSASKRLNASAALGSPGQGWEVRVLCKNLNNERTLGFVFPAPLEPPGNAAGMPLDPRTVLLQLSYKP